MRMSSVQRYLKKSFQGRALTKRLRANGGSAPCRSAESSVETREQLAQAQKMINTLRLKVSAIFLSAIDMTAEAAARCL